MLIGKNLLLIVMSLGFYCLVLLELTPKFLFKLSPPFCPPPNLRSVGVQPTTEIHSSIPLIYSTNPQKSQSVSCFQAGMVYLTVCICVLYQEIIGAGWNLKYASTYFIDFTFTGSKLLGHHLFAFYHSIRSCI